MYLLLTRSDKGVLVVCSVLFCSVCLSTFETVCTFFGKFGPYMRLSVCLQVVIIAGEQWPKKKKKRERHYVVAQP